MTHDIVGVGEAMLRLWVHAEARLENAPAFEVTVAGAEANVAIAAARFGARTAWLSILPNNSLGRRAAREIAAHGVDVSHVTWVDDARMGTYFVELGVAPRPTAVVYDRADSAASKLDVSSIDWDVVEGARIVHITGITAALSSSARDLALELVQRASAAGTFVSLDVNYRRKLWEPDECRQVIESMAGSCDLVVATSEDALDVFGIAGPPGAVCSDIASHLGAVHTVVTAGAGGAHWVSGGSVGHAPGYPDAETVDRIGAGDAFAAGVLLGVLDDDVPGGVERGVAMAALKLGAFGDQLTVGPDEVDRLMQGHGREVSR